MDHDFVVEKRYKNGSERDFSRVHFTYINTRYTIAHYFDTDLWCIVKDTCMLYAIVVKQPNDYLALMYELLRIFDYRKIREILEYLS